VFIKICGITDAEDALVAAGLGANAVGLVFAASSRRVSTGVAADVVRRLPPEVTAVGVFSGESRERILDIASSVGLTAVQIHGSGPAEDTQWLSERIPVVIRAFSVHDAGLKNWADYGASRIHIDSVNPGGGKTFDWNLLNQMPIGHDCILAGGLNPQNVGDAIQQVGPWGVDVSSGVESAPGRKDAVKMRHFVAAARQHGGELQGGLDTIKLGSQINETDTGSARTKPFNWEED